MAQATAGGTGGSVPHSTGVTTKAALTTQVFRRTTFDKRQTAHSAGRLQDRQTGGENYETGLTRPALADRSRTPAQNLKRL